MSSKVLSAIGREPYRIFFPLGICFGIVGVSHWLFFALGWIPSYSMMFRSSIQMQAYMSCFVIGFLLTSIPRFSGSPPAKPSELFFFLLFVAGIIGFYGSSLFFLCALCFL